MDGQLLPQSSDDLSSRIDGRRRGSFDGYAGSRDGSSFTTTAHGGGSYHSFTYGQQQQQQQSRSVGAVNPFQAHFAARDGVRGFGSSDNLAGLGLPGHQRAGETDYVLFALGCTVGCSVSSVLSAWTKQLRRWPPVCH